MPCLGFTLAAWQPCSVAASSVLSMQAVHSNGHLCYASITLVPLGGTRAACSVAGAPELLALKHSSRPTRTLMLDTPLSTLELRDIGDWQCVGSTKRRLQARAWTWGSDMRRVKHAP
jgi:hypothetical protein